MKCKNPSKHTISLSWLSLKLLRVHSPNAQKRKNLWKTSKPCHVGTHWKALAEYFHMSTHLPGFRWFFRFFALFCFGRISHQQHKGYAKLRYSCCKLPSYLKTTVPNGNEGTKSGLVGVCNKEALILTGMSRLQRLRNSSLSN